MNLFLTIKEQDWKICVSLRGKTGKEYGYLTATEVSDADAEDWYLEGECLPDVAEVRRRTGAKGPVYAVKMVKLVPSLRGKGIGRRMYIEVARYVREKHDGVVVADACVFGHTSEAAMMTWSRMHQPGVVESKGKAIAAERRKNPIPSDPTIVTPPGYELDKKLWEGSDYSIYPDFDIYAYRDRPGFFVSNRDFFVFSEGAWVRFEDYFRLPTRRIRFFRFVTGSRDKVYALYNAGDHVDVYTMREVF